MAKVAADAGADAVSLTNTFLAMSIDVETRRPRLTTSPGAFQAPRSSRSRCAWSTRRRSAVTIPILGMGGIVTPEDAVEFLLAGATAVQVGTASYADPRAVERLARDLESWCRSHQVERVASLTGALEASGQVGRRTDSCSISEPISTVLSDSRHRMWAGDGPKRTSCASPLAPRVTKTPVIQRTATCFLESYLRSVIRRFPLGSIGLWMSLTSTGAR